jgi:copper ion binding protein
MSIMKTELKVEGMSCQHCVNAVQEALEGIPGVQKAKVNLKKASAVVKHDETVVADALVGAIKEAGFQVP